MGARRVAVVVGLVMMVAACAPPGDTSRAAANRALGADFGNAVSHNAAQQIIHPVPRAATPGSSLLDGHRAGLALERYKRGSVVTPERIETTTFGDDR